MGLVRENLCFDTEMCNGLKNDIQKYFLLSQDRQFIDTYGVFTMHQDLLKGYVIVEICVSTQQSCC